MSRVLKLNSGKFFYDYLTTKRFPTSKQHEDASDADDESSDDERSDDKETPLEKSPMLGETCSYDIKLPLLDETPLSLDEIEIIPPPSIKYIDDDDDEEVDASLPPADSREAVPWKSSLRKYDKVNNNCSGLFLDIQSRYVFKKMDDRITACGVHILRKGLRRMTAAEQSYTASVGY